MNEDECMTRSAPPRTCDKETLCNKNAAPVNSCRSFCRISSNNKSLRADSTAHRVRVYNGRLLKGERTCAENFLFCYFL